MRAPLTALAALLLAAASCTGAGPSGESEGEVVVYTSVDQPFSEPVLREFERETGIAVKPVYDVEAAKTTGLANRLRAEKDHPLADVWWNGEFAQTLELARGGAFAPYRSPSAADLPETILDEGNLWSGFGGRARVLVANTDLLSPEELPSSVHDLASPPTDAELVGMAYPLFGTTATHAAALYAVLGADEAREYYERVADAGITIVEGNSVVRDMVADGRLAFGITDTDDACGAIDRGAPLVLALPDQAEGEIGTLVIPNTVALVAGAPNPDQGKALIDYLLGREVEARLVDAGWFQVSPRHVGEQGSCVDPSSVRAMDVSLVDIADHMEQAKTELGDIFVR